MEAGRRVLSWFHEELAARHNAGFADDKRSALVLMHWRDMALGVLADSGLQRRTWLDAAEAAGVKPRSICVGGREIFDGSPGVLTAYSYRRGCFEVFDEKTNVSSKKWPDVCPSCRRLQTHRAARRAMKRMTTTASTSPA